MTTTLRHESPALSPWITKTEIPADSKQNRSYCVICNYGCGILADVEDGKITKVLPDKDNPFSRGHACNKAASIPFLPEHAQRVRHPLKRTADGSFEQISWEQAIKEIAAKLNETLDKHGPRALAAQGMGGQSNHMGAQPYLLLLEQLGSKRWFCAYAQEKTQHHLVESKMFDAPSTMMFIGNCENTDYLLSVGSNPKVSNLMRHHTVALKDIRKGENRKLVVVDPRVSDMCKDADRHLPIKPGTDAYFFLGILKTIVDRDLVDHAWLAENTIGYERIVESVANVDVDEMARRCALPVEDITLTAEELATAKTAVIEAGLGAEHVRYSTLVSYLIRLLAVITGNANKKGGHVFHGTLSPTNLADDRFDEPPRTVASGIQGVRALSPFHMFSPTLLPEEIEVDHPDRIRALICDTSNPVIAYSDAERWKRALRKLDLFVVVDMNMSETARLADYVLPAAGAYEKWEFTGFPKSWPEITFQLRRPITPMPEGIDAKAEPEIYISILREMGVFGEVPAELHELAKNIHTPEGAGAYMMRSLELATGYGDANPIPRLGYWAFEAVGPHLPAQSIAPVWIDCMLGGLFRPHVHIASLGEEFANADPFKIGTELFERIIDHPEGVEVGRFDPETAWQEHVGWEDNKVRLVIDEILPEIDRAIDNDVSRTDPDYPYLVSVGVRTRWTANSIHRSTEWRKGRGPHCTLHMSGEDAGALGVENGDMVRVRSNVGSIELPAEIEKGVQAGHAWMPNGFGTDHGSDGIEDVLGANGNILTDAEDRDPITGCPHHKAVRCTIERATAA